MSKVIVHETKVALATNKWKYESMSSIKNVAKSTNNSKLMDAVLNVIKLCKKLNINNDSNNDDELNALERELGLDGDDDDAILRNIQEQRKNELKKQWKNKQKNISKGNAGRYEEYDERQMLKEASKQNINMIIHFYADTIPRGLIVDEHFKKLAPKHMETKFIKLNARKSPFLVNKWKIKTLPSICIIQNGYLTDKIIGFDDFGGIDEFPTAAMERRFAKSGAIKDKNGKFNKKKKKTKVLTDL
mmetsp:Transcript_43885/g.53816  ORF Transcript_43885/g.53816 Transcript_43885/m.53816 type:complete len:245 (-) Transcript_43885:85-819(-)